MKANQLLVIGSSLAILGGVILPAGNAQGPDIYARPIAADEPIEPKGFPPLPAKLDLPLAQASSKDAFAPAPPPAPPQRRNFNGYNHAPTIIPPKETFTQRDVLTQKQARDADQSSAEHQRYEQQMEQLRHLPNRNEPRIREPNGPLVEPPQGVTIDQSHTQELSLPDDNNASSKRNSNGQRNFVQRIENRLQNNVKNQMPGPIRNFGGF
jgi:hypothetical protein